MLARLLPLLMVLALVRSQASAPSQWDWVAPVPHRQTWVDLAAGTNGFVGLTDGFGGRQIYHSTNGAQWDLIQTPVRVGLRRIVFANGNYLAVGAQESILSSQDGTDWQVRHQTSLGAVLFDVAYGNGAYVVVGYNSRALVSKDLKNWYPIDFPTGHSLVAVKFGNGVFIAIANSGLIYRSYDGRAWTSSAWPNVLGSGDPAMFEVGFAFNNGKFVLSVPGGTAVSEDGASWNVVSTEFYQRISPGGVGFASASGGRLDVSPDGLNWRTSLLVKESNAQINAIAESKGNSVAAGDNGLLYTCLEGGTWQTQLPPIDYSRGNVGFANDLFVRFGMEPGHYLSADGKTWSFNTNAPALASLTSGNNMAIGVTESGSFAISADLTNWDEINPPAAPRGEIVFGNGTFICAAQGGVLVSDNGRSWELVSIAGVGSVRLIGFQNGVFAALSNTSQPLTSTDGRNWTAAPAQSESAAQFYSAGNGRFVGIGGGGMGPGFVTWSTDGAHWQRQRLVCGSSYPYTGLSFGGRYFLMTDDNGGIFYSNDGINWEGERQASQSWTGAAYGNGTWIVVGGDSILRCIGTMAGANTAASLQISQSNLSAWSLTLSGAVGEHWQIQSCSGIGGSWSPFQTVSIPVSGKITVPLSAQQSSAFFRAIIQP